MSSEYNSLLKDGTTPGSNGATFDQHDQVDPKAAYGSLNTPVVVVNGLGGGGGGDATSEWREHPIPVPNDLKVVQSPNNDLNGHSTIPDEIANMTKNLVGCGVLSLR